MRGKTWLEIGEMLSKCFSKMFAFLERVQLSQSLLLVVVFVACRGHSGVQGSGGNI